MFGVRVIVKVTKEEDILDKLKVVTTHLVLWFRMFQIEANSQQFLNWCSELPEISFFKKLGFHVQLSLGEHFKCLQKHG